MRFFSIGAVVIASMLAGGDIMGVTAPSQRPEVADKQPAPAVDAELVIAVDVSYSMDLDELAVQREGYAQAIVSKEFLQALRTGLNSRRIFGGEGRLQQGMLDRLVLGLTTNLPIPHPQAHAVVGKQRCGKK